jgi:uncharacterized protein YecE (DUF72 family)
MVSYFVGTSGWNYDCWKNDFYAAQSAGPHWLSRCAADISAAETNASFYRLISDTAGTRLRQRATAGFRYTLKLPRPVTHQRLLNDIEAEVAVFWRAAALLQDRLGAILMQVSPDLPLDLGWLRTVLQAFADPSRVAVEFRAPTWQGEEVRRQLETVGAAHVCVDSPHTLPSDWVTGKRAYLRLHGRRRWYADSYTLPELDEIGQRVRRMAVRGAEEIYIIFNNDVDGAAQANASALGKRLQ